MSKPTHPHRTTLERIEQLEAEARRLRASLEEAESPAGSPPSPGEPRGKSPDGLRGVHLNHFFGSGAAQSQVLRDVSIEVAVGEFVLIMGPSGSGKSTLLAAVSGLLRPSSGQVLVRGQDLWKMSEREREAFRLRHFGFIFQGYNLFPTLTAREQLDMVAQWGEGRTRAEAGARSVEMLELLGLGSKGDLLPAQLSGGEKQRVAIARALLKSPDFCFADEPTSALDWEHGKQVIELLREVARQQGAAVLVVAHDARIAPYADHVLHLEDGRLRAASPASPGRTG